MKKVTLWFLILSFTILLMGCQLPVNPGIPTESTEPVTDINIDNIWNDEFVDEQNEIFKDDITNANLFYNGSYVELDASTTSRKDVKYEFYTNEKLRFVNSADQYALTIPATEVTIDYSLSQFRVQIGFAETLLTISREASNPYGDTEYGWSVYLNEWLDRYIENDQYLIDNNLTRTRDVIISEDILDGYEVQTYSIYIANSAEIAKPYYNISIIREKSEYIEFYLLVMKSDKNEEAVHDEIVKSFKEVKKYGTAKNHQGQYELVSNPKWNEETNISSRRDY